MNWCWSASWRIWAEPERLIQPSQSSLPSYKKPSFRCHVLRVACLYISCVYCERMHASIMETQKKDSHYMKIKLLPALTLITSSLFFSACNNVAPTADASAKYCNPPDPNSDSDYKNQMLYVRFPAGTAPSSGWPAIVYFPGDATSSATFNPAMTAAVNRGYVAVAVNYLQQTESGTPNIHPLQIASQARCAIRFVNDHVRRTWSCILPPIRGHTSGPSKKARPSFETPTAVDAAPAFPGTSRTVESSPYSDQPSRRNTPSPKNDFPSTVSSSNTGTS
jgi:hypothetical protein